MNLTNLFLTEFFGTMLLIILGNGIVANVVLKDTKGHNAGWLAITFGWGFAVTIAVIISSAFNGKGWFNPAVMIGAMIQTKGEVLRTFGETVYSIETAVGIFFGLLGTQLLGAILGQIIIDILYYKHIELTLKGNDAFATANVLGMHATGPTTRSIILNLLMEIVGTMVLVFAALHIAKEPSNALGAISIGIVIIGIGLSLGGTTGYAINPVRDLGPRIVHMFLPAQFKGNSDWGYAAIPVAGPMIGGALIGLISLAL